MFVWFASLFFGLATATVTVPQSELPPGLQNALTGYFGASGGGDSILSPT